MEIQVRVENQIPKELHQAMVGFIAKHPQWPQHRLRQAAVAGFLFQHGAKTPAVVEHYLSGIFNGPARSGLP